MKNVPHIKKSQMNVSGNSSQNSFRIINEVKIYDHVRGDESDSGMGELISDASN